MLIAKKIHASKSIIGKAGAEPSKLVQKLNEFLDDELAGTARILYGAHSALRDYITYADIRVAVETGIITDEALYKWRTAYAERVKEVLEPKWERAFEAAVQDRAPKGIRFDPMAAGIKEWTKTRTAYLVTAETQTVKDAIAALVREAYETGMSTDQLAQRIRPLIGLNERQAVANVRYCERIYNKLLKDNPNMREATAAKRADKAALKYAEKQHRFRAKMIAQTELSYAYNNGAELSIRKAQALGLMGEVRRRWITAHNEKVCVYCAGLDGKTTAMDKSFKIKGKEIQIPPAHPLCKCVVAYDPVK